MSIRRVGMVAAGIACARHASPALTAMGPVRRAAFPALAGSGGRGHVAITFDDGPDPVSTPAFIEVLADLDVTATFFVLGRMLEAAPDLGRRLVDAGHEVGVHGWDHRVLLARGYRSTLADLMRTTTEVRRTCGVTPQLWRPPFGVLSGGSLRAARVAGLRPVLWTTWGRDWERRATPDTVRDQVRRHLRPGGTVLLHDSDCTSTPGSWRATLAALPGVVSDVRELGLQPGPLREHGLWAVR